MRDEGVKKKNFVTCSPVHSISPALHLSITMRTLARVSAVVAPLALLALAFFLRIYRLGDKNVWWDEGWTVWLSQHDLAWIALRTASDEHPPLHYWLMHVWQGLFGTDAFTGRFLSLAFGVLLVALIYRLGKSIGGTRLGLLAALFLALARFNVWWSQDIKNYTLSAFFAWASVYFVYELVDRRQRADGRHRDSHQGTVVREQSPVSYKIPGGQQGMLWMGYVLATFLGLFSHYLAALIFLANNLFVGIVILDRWRRGEKIVPFFIRWALAQLAVVVLFAPWLYLYLQNGATWSAAPAFDFGLFLRLAATVLTLGVTTFIENYTWIVLGMLAVAALSAGWLVTRPSLFLIPHLSSLRLGTLSMLLIALVPPALIYILALTPAAIFAPKIQARYLMMLTPAVAMLLALGVTFFASMLRGRLVQVAPAALIVLVLVAQLYTLNDYFGERVLRDEYTTLSQMINNFALPGDAIVLNTDQEYPTFLYYLKRPLDWVGVPNGTPVTPAIAQRVASTASQHNAVWVVSIPDALQQDLTHQVEQKIAERLSKRYEQTFGDKRLTLYANVLRNVKDVPGETFSPQMPRDDEFDERLKLIGVDLPVREAYPGDVVSVVTYWQAQDVTTINLSLQTASGEIVARAAIPISIGAHERAQGDLQIPPAASAGELRVVAQARLRSLPIGTLGVLPRSGVNPNATDAALQPRTERFGASERDAKIHLVGFSAPAQTFHAGDTVPLTLYWQTDAPVTTGYTVFVHLLGTQYNPAQNNLLWGQIDRIPLDGKLPTTAWAPNQTIADPYPVKFDEHAPAGSYKIEIGLYDAATGTRLQVFDAQGKDVGDSVVVGAVSIP